MPQPVYDLVFHDSRVQSESPAQPAGWSGGHAPAIGADAWPRSKRTGFPMSHLLTLELPPEYRRKGPELVGIALFQADDHAAEPTPGAEQALTEGAAPSNAAFFASLLRAHASRHPQQVDLVDIIDGNFALIWLRAEEISGPRTAPPADDRASANVGDPGQNMNAWDHPEPEIAISLALRAFDPNAGKAPVETRRRVPDEGEYVDSAAYVDVTVSNDETLRAFYAEHHGRSHLGGTCFPVQAMPEGLTPWFLELEDGVAEANFGGGTMQLDLESGTFGWAC